MDQDRLKPAFLDDVSAAGVVVGAVVVGFVYPLETPVGAFKCPLGPLGVAVFSRSATLGEVDLTALGSLGAGIVFFAFSSCNSCTGEPGSDRGYASGVGQGAAARAGLAAAAMDRKPKAEVRSKAATKQLYN